MKLRLAVLLFAVALLAPPGLAQTPDNAPIQTLSPRDACPIVAFYRVFDATPPQTREQYLNREPRPPADITPRFIARLFVTDTFASGKRPMISWADQETCPALEPALASLGGVLALRFTGEGPGDRLTLTMDGVLYHFWAGEPFYPHGLLDYRYTFEAESNIGSPLAKWIDTTMTALERCWTSTPPALTPTP